MRLNMVYSKIGSLWVVLRIVLLLTVTGLTAAQQMDIPMKLQAALFKKILGMNKTIIGKEIKIAVLYNNAKIKDEVIEAFKQFGVFPESVTLKEFEKQAQNYNVVYITPGSPSIKAICDKNKIFTITGVPELVENGEASVGIAVEGGKPKIIINKKKVETEGQELTVELFKLAKVL